MNENYVLYMMDQTTVYCNKLSQTVTKKVTKNREIDMTDKNEQCPTEGVVSKMQMI